MNILKYILLLLHAGLFIWSAGGFLEMVMPEVFWPEYTNPAFPDWLLLFHWGSVLFASTVFIYGYKTRWNKTPVLMAAGYSVMALVCLVETVWYMTNSTKYFAMAAEYSAYIAILWLLFRSEYFRNYFNRARPVD